MKESVLVKMQHDLKLVQQVAVVLLKRVEVLEKKLEERVEEKQYLLKKCLYLQKQNNYVRRIILSILHYPRTTRDSKRPYTT